MEDEKKKIVQKKESPKRSIYLGEPPKEALDKISGKIGRIAPHLKNKFTKDELIQIIREARVDYARAFVCECNYCWCFCDCDCVCWCIPPYCDCGFCLCEDIIDVTKPILLKDLKEKIETVQKTIKNIETRFGDIKEILSELKKNK